MRDEWERARAVGDSYTLLSVWATTSLGNAGGQLAQAGFPVPCPVRAGPHNQCG